MEVDQGGDEGNLQNKDDGNADHEGRMLGFVADQLHGDVHGQRTARGRPQEQGFFGNAEFYVILLGNLFVVNANDYGNQGDYQKICNNYGFNRVCFDQV